MKTKQYSRKEENDYTDLSGKYAEDALYGGSNGLDDYRRDENGLDSMSELATDDCLEGHPI